MHGDSKLDRFMHRYIILLVLLASVYLLCMPMVGRLNPSIAVENGLMENIQLTLVLLFIVALLSRLRGADRELHSVFYGGISFGFVCAMREIDLRRLNAPRWVELIETGIGSDIIISVLLLAMIYFIIKAGMSLKRRVFLIPGLPFGVLSIASALAMFIGSIFEETSLGGDRSQIYEEYFEIFAYFLMLTAALSAGSLRRISGMSHGTLSPQAILPD